MRWFKNFSVGQSVEVFVPLAIGGAWLPGVVSRKTKTGHPIVQVKKLATSPDVAFTVAVDRKGDIRHGL